MKLFRVICCLFVLLLSLIVFAFVPRSQASAASGLVTKGDVEAILHAGYPSTGCAPIFQAHPVPGFEDCTRAAIIPFNIGSVRHYCVDDWHIVRFIYFTGVDNVDIFTKKQAIDELNRSFAGGPAQNTPVVFKLIDKSNAPDTKGWLGDYDFKAEYRKLWGVK